MKLKHHKFVKIYLEIGNANEAAEMLGYPRTYGSILLQRPEIKKAIEEEKERISERNRVTVDVIVAELRQQLTWAKNGQPIVDRNGYLLGYQRDPKTALKAIEKLGETIGAFTRKIEASGPGGKPLVPELSSEERAERIKFLMSVVNGGSAHGQKAG